METSHLLSPWVSFYRVVGPAGAVLIGLQFVVITLLAERRAQTTPDTISAFGTPTVVHFGAALFVSAIIIAPWHSLWGITGALLISSLVGITYELTAIGRARRQTNYRPEWEDWLWHGVLPLGVYATLAVGAVLLHVAPAAALDAVGGAALALLLIGIHNSWDAVTYHVVGGPKRDESPAEEFNQPG
jgi:hypothetical protein